MGTLCAGTGVGSDGDASGGGGDASVVSDLRQELRPVSCSDASMSSMESVGAYHGRLWEDGSDWNGSVSDVSFF